MILLLCVDTADADRFRRLTATEQAVLEMPGRDVPHGVQPGAYVVRTNRWRYDERAVSALRSLATRVQLVDPTGLLGPVLPSPEAKTREPYGSAPIGLSLESSQGSDMRRRRAGGV